MIGTVLTIVVCASLFALSRSWWRSYLNPVSLGILAWTPGLVMLNWPPFFLSPVYIHLNRPVSALVYYAMALGFLSFWAGCAVVKAMVKRDAFLVVPERLRLRADPVKLLGLFGLGFAVFLYAYMQSGLLDLAYLDERQVQESQLNLHLGLMSFVIIFMDIAAIGFFARFLQTGKWHFVVPIVVALLSYGATLQKSPLVWILSACILVAALHARASYHLFLRSTPRRLAVALLGVVIFMGLIAMNQARGIAAVQMTAASSPLTEQIYIYSGASSIMNLSVTLDGYLPSDPPRMGAYLGRPILWHFLDRDIFTSGRYFEGVNAATYLNYGWLDFRWLGFFITPFLTGILVMLYIRGALAGSLAGLIFGAVAFRAIIFSAGTDIMFDPTVAITLVLAVIADLFVRRIDPRLGESKRHQESSHQRRPVPY